MGQSLTTGRRPGVTEEPEEISVTLLVTQALEDLGIAYVIAGGLASIIHGEIRTTLDADVLVDLKLEHVDRLAAALEPDFYLDAESIREAITSRRSFNVLHRDTMFKVDVFVPKTRPFDLAQFERRMLKIVAEAPDRRAWVASPEDTVLSKLEWYKLGAGVSEKQWRDVLGVLKTQAGSLDLAYMRRTADQLVVRDLLEMALEGASPPEEPEEPGDQARLL